MNWMDLFNATLPVTVLEVAALLVLVVDLAVLRKASESLRLTVAALMAGNHSTPDRTGKSAVSSDSAYLTARSSMSELPAHVASMWASICTSA